MLVALILALPILLFGPLVDGHDTPEHLNFTRHFDEQFWQGDLYPRWIVDMNAGLGSPTMFIYPPLPIYVAVLLSPLAKLLPFHLFQINPFTVAVFLALAGSGLTAFVWLRTLASETVAAVCACLYMLMPYHLAIDLYRRMALSECWGFVWMPLILYFTAGAMAGRRRSSIGLAISFALMILSHLISVAMFFAIPIAFALALSDPGKRIRSAIDVVLAMALGTGISAVYLFPALAATRHISTADLRERHGTYMYLISFGRSLFRHTDFEYFEQKVAWIVVSMTLLVAICSFEILTRKSGGSRRITLFWLGVAILYLFIMSRLSLPIWRSVAALGRAIQFPFRLVAILSFATLPLLAGFLPTVAQWTPKRKVAYSVCLTVIFSFWIYTYGNVWWRYHVDVAMPKVPGQEVNDHDGWLAEWIPPGTVQSASLAASKGPEVRFRQGTGTALLRVWKPRLVEFESDSPTGGAVMIRQFYYPEWKAEMLDGSRPLIVKTALPEGLIEVDAPPGSHRIRVEMPVSPVERLGRWVSAASLLFAMGGLLKTSFRGQFNLTIGH